MNFQKFVLNLSKPRDNLSEKRLTFYISISLQTWDRDSHKNVHMQIQKFDYRQRSWGDEGCKGGVLPFCVDRDMPLRIWKWPIHIQISPFLTQMFTKIKQLFSFFFFFYKFDLSQFEGILKNNSHNCIQNFAFDKGSLALIWQKAEFAVHPQIGFILSPPPPDFNKFVV